MKADFLHKVYIKKIKNLLKINVFRQKKRAKKKIKQIFYIK